MVALKPAPGGADTEGTGSGGILGAPKVFEAFLPFRLDSLPGPVFLP